MSVEAKVKSIIAEQLGVGEDEIKAASAFIEDLGADSLDIVELVMAIGLVTPLGIGNQATWEAAIAGKSGVGPITRFDASQLPCRIAGEVKGFDPSRFMDKKEARRNDLFIQFGLAASQMALQDARLPTDE